MDELNQQAKFEGWAILELLGRQQEIGYVATEYFGGVAMFRVDTPQIDAFVEKTKRPGYASTNYGHIDLPAGTDVEREAIPARSLYVNPGSLYRLNPCTEEVAREAIKALAYSSRPLRLLKPPEGRALPEGRREDGPDYETEY